MKSCFGYVRVSTQKQGEGVSLEAQREAIERYAAQHDLTVIKWFEEKETAAKAGRPIFSGMIKALRNGEALGVIMHKIDRSARNFADWAKVGELSDAGIDVHFATETLDFRSRGGRLSADIQAVIAADYIRNLREETLKGMRGRLKQGLYPFGAPIGYLNNGGGKPKTIDLVRGPLVKQAFELYGSGQHSLRSLVKEMEKEGLRNTAGRPVTKHGIETILSNPFYCGLTRIKRTGETFKGAHEPLITAALFERVQDIRAGKCGKKVTKHNHTYRGLFRCQHCNAAMTPEKQKSYIYYRCQTPSCPTTTVREEAIEQAVLEVLGTVQLTDADIAELTKEIEVWCESRTDTGHNDTIAMQIANITQKLESLTDALIDRLIDKDTFNGRKEKLLLEQKRWEEEAEKQAKMQAEPDRVQKFLELIKSLKNNYLFANPAERRRLLKNTTSNRTVSGRNVYLEPANWLRQAESALGVLCGDPHRPTSRRKSDTIELLIEATKHEDLQNLT